MNNLYTIQPKAAFVAGPQQPYRPLRQKYSDGRKKTFNVTIATVTGKSKALYVQDSGRDFVLFSQQMNDKSGVALKSRSQFQVTGTVDEIRRYWPPGAIPECSLVTALDNTLNSDALARCKCFNTAPINSVPEADPD
ncbi:hypothetical protein UY3_01586 [Chelonia mydas]|uniref:Uncharacterized protein n=1 Tax=Chelonia mydas TaxID=8469 RepID=M7CJG6_CHEMY|nr:hypothetical protein UY3_01586 [Chelonia mydas]